jgi:hypothetical protein
MQGSDQGIPRHSDPDVHPSSRHGIGLPVGVSLMGWQVDRAPTGIAASLTVTGLAVNVLMVGIGILWAIPTFGLFGVLWTGFAVFIAISNIRRLIVKRGSDR